MNLRVYEVYDEVRECYFLHLASNDRHLIYNLLSDRDFRPDRSRINFVARFSSESGFRTDVLQEVDILRIIKLMEADNAENIQRL